MRWAAIEWFSVRFRPAVSLGSIELVSLTPAGMMTRLPSAQCLACLVCKSGGAAKCLGPWMHWRLGRRGIKAWRFREEEMADEDPGARDNVRQDPGWYEIRADMLQGMIPPGYSRWCI